MASWTPCTKDCEHRGPYRIHYKSGMVAMVRNPRSAKASWALEDYAGIVDRVMAPHG